MASRPSCATCHYAYQPKAGVERRVCCGPQRPQRNGFHGPQLIVADVRQERAWRWRLLGLNTCGPRGRYYRPIEGEVRHG